MGDSSMLEVTSHQPAINDTKQTNVCGVLVCKKVFGTKISPASMPTLGVCHHTSLLTAVVFPSPHSGKPSSPCQNPSCKPHAFCAVFIFVPLLKNVMNLEIANEYQNNLINIFVHVMPFMHSVYKRFSNHIL